MKLLHFEQKSKNIPALNLEMYTTSYPVQATKGSTQTILSVSSALRGSINSGPSQQMN